MANQDDLAHQLRELQQQMEALRANNAPPQDLHRAQTQRVKIHLPKFTRNSPQLWFAQVERSFRLHDVSDDTDKFDFVAVHLEEDVVIVVEDLIIRPPATDKYESLKARLLQKFAESPESKLRRLLQGGDTTDLKPSEILAHMRRLAPDPGSENMILTLFLAEMPQAIRPVLSVWEETDLDKLAKIADKMIDAIGTSTTFAISSTPKIPVTHEPNVNAVSPPCSLKEISNTLQALTQKFDSMQKDVKRLQSASENQERARNRSRNRSRVPDRGQQSGDHTDRQTQQSTLCYYHEKYGNDARKYRSPCTYQQQQQQQLN